jgi:hypothetical protein
MPAITRVHLIAAKQSAPESAATRLMQLDYRHRRPVRRVVASRRRSRLKRSDDHVGQCALLSIWQEVQRVRLPALNNEIIGRDLWIGRDRVMALERLRLPLFVGLIGRIAINDDVQAGSRCFASSATSFRCSRASSARPLRLPSRCPCAASVPRGPVAGTKKPLRNLSSRPCITVRPRNVPRLCTRHKEHLVCSACFVAIMVLGAGRRRPRPAAGFRHRFRDCPCDLPYQARRLQPRPCRRSAVPERDGRRQAPLRHRYAPPLWRSQG